MSMFTSNPCAKLGGTGWVTGRQNSFLGVNASVVSGLPKGEVKAYVAGVPNTRLVIIKKPKNNAFVEEVHARLAGKAYRQVVFYEGDDARGEQYGISDMIWTRSAIRAHFPGRDFVFGQETAELFRTNMPIIGSFHIRGFHTSIAEDTTVSDVLRQDVANLVSHYPGVQKAGEVFLAGGSEVIKRAVKVEVRPQTHGDTYGDTILELWLTRDGDYHPVSMIAGMIDRSGKLMFIAANNQTREQLSVEVDPKYEYEGQPRHGLPPAHFVRRAQAALQGMATMLVEENFCGEPGLPDTYNPHTIIAFTNYMEDLRSNGIEMECTDYIS